MADDSPAAIKILFDEMDVNNDGKLDRSEVKKVAEKLFCADSTHEVTSEELDYMMSQMDADGNGEVDYDEFARWWTGLGWDLQKTQAIEAGVDTPEPVGYLLGRALSAPGSTSSAAAAHRRTKQTSKTRSMR